jgi:hypothetical protein
MTQKYLVVSGVMLLLLAVVGFFVESFAGIMLGGAQLALYLVAGVIALGTTYIRRSRMHTARWFGGVFMGLAVLGVIAPGLLTFARLDNGVAANILHFLIGIWGLWIGFLGREIQLDIKNPLRAREDEESFL